ncbi:MAG: hypothetical protein M1815_005812 [Lichina confinis]|nr:MAG: hypothetical protein M1815_005812 [Lichina confinis]
MATTPARNGAQPAPTTSARPRTVKPRDSIDIVRKSQTIRPSPRNTPDTEKPWPSPPMPEQSAFLARAHTFTQPASPAPSAFPSRKPSLKQKQRSSREKVLGETSLYRSRSLRRDRSMRRPRLSSVGGRKTTTATTMPGSDVHGLGGADVDPELSARTGKWNLLGGLFGKRNLQTPVASPPDTPSKASPVGGSIRTSASDGQNVLEGQPPSSEPPRGLFRSRSRLRSARHRGGHVKPEIKRTVTVPTRAHDVSKPLPIPGEAPTMRRHPKDPRRLLLDVEIPSVQLERYSVMFSNVLQHNSSTPTLLSGAQAQTGKLREAEREACSRTVSPQLSAPESTDDAWQPRLKPLAVQNHRRSRSVAHLKLADPPTITGHVGVVVHSPGAPMASRSKSFTVTSNQSPRPLPPLPPPLPSKTPSPGHEGDVAMRLALNSRANSWQSESRPMPLAEICDSRDRPGGGHYAATTEDDQEREEREALAQAAAEISIARQISVSRQQRLRLGMMSKTPSNEASPALLSSSSSSSFSSPILPRIRLPTPPTSVVATVGTGNGSRGAPPFFDHSSVVASPFPASSSAPVTPAAFLADSHAPSPLQLAPRSHPHSHLPASASPLHSPHVDSEERFVDRKGLGAHPIVVQHSPTSPSCRKSQRVMLEIA